MTHKQFIHAYTKGLCIPRIEPTEAVHVMFSDGVARRLRLTYYTWFIIWLSLVGLTVFFLSTASVINALVIMVFVYFLPYGMVRYSADYIITKALEDESFFRFAVGSKVMVIEQSMSVNSGGVRNNNLQHQQ
ncbi:MAG: hypothetical protein ACOC41_01625 [Chitinivibrionales bacterium]